MAAFDFEALAPYTPRETLAANWVGAHWIASQEDDPSLPGLVWIQEIRKSDHGQLSPQRWRRFLEESKELVEMDHPALLKIAERRESEGQVVWLLSPIQPLPGSSIPRTLAQLLSEHEPGRLKEANAAAMLEALLEGLAFLHDLGLSFGRLRPSSVWLDWQQKPPIPKAIHYGFGALVGEDLEGDPFVAPEQRRQGGAGVLSDIYSSGALLWWMLRGEPPPSREPFSDPDEELLPWAWPEAPDLGLPVLRLFRLALPQEPPRRAQDVPELLSRFRDTPSISHAGLRTADFKETLPYTPEKRESPVSLPIPRATHEDAKQTLPYDFQLSEALEQLPLVQEFEAEALVSQEQPETPSSERWSQLEAPEIPEPIPEQWEREALRADSQLNRQLGVPVRLLALGALAAFLLWWLRQACQ